MLNTGPIAVETAVQTIRTLLETRTFTMTAESRQQLVDQSIVAQAKVALQAEPTTRSLGLVVSSSRGYVRISGMVDFEDQREALLPGQVIRYTRSFLLWDRFELPGGSRVGLWHLLGFRLQLVPDPIGPIPVEDDLVERKARDLARAVTV